MTTLLRPRKLARLVSPSRALGLLALQLCVAATLGCGSSGEHPGEAVDQDGDIDVGAVAYDATTDGNVCGQPGYHEGCACSTVGQTMECGKIVKQDGSYVTCSMGHATCDGSVWGACNGDRFIEKSLHKTTLFPDGHRPLYTSTTCANVCDPNPGCVDLTGNIGDVDAGDAAVYPAPDGGISLVPSDAIPSDGGCTGTGLQCAVVACGGDAGLTTTLTGTVYDPAGKNPLYGATVYIPVDPTGTLPVFTQGVSCDTCGGAAALNAVNVATTAADGTFTMTNVPSGANIPIVVQMGKWRREILLTTVTSCTGNTVTNNCTATDKTLCKLRLPGSQTDGYNKTYAGGSLSTYNHADMPQIAMVSGAADPLECMLLKAGISTSEIASYDMDTGGTVHKLHFFESPNAPGSHLDSHYGHIKTATSLWTDTSSPSTSTTTPGQYGYYDVVLDACEGSAINKHNLHTTTPGEPYNDLINYTKIGGRAFLTHYSYVWLEYPSHYGYVTGTETWNGVANWTSLTGTTYTGDPLDALINISFPKGKAFADWLFDVGASSTYQHLNIHEGRKDLSTVGASSQGWMTANSGGSFVPHFTFNTPYTSLPAAQCGRVVYSDFHVSASALVGGSGTCYSAADCGFGQTCTGSPGTVGTCNEPCGTTADCKDSTYSCDGATAGQCLPTSCAAGVTTYACSVGTCNGTHTACLCTADAQCPSKHCVNSGQIGCTGATCTGTGTPGSDGCQTDAVTACTASTAYTCSDTKFTCTTGSGTCPGVVTGSIAAPSAVCTGDSTKKCDTSGTKCVCTSDAQCAGVGPAKCVNVSSNCTGTCTGTGTVAGTDYNENYCQLRPPMPTPVSSASTCPDTSISGCTGGQCNQCTSDSQCKDLWNLGYPWGTSGVCQSYWSWCPNGATVDAIGCCAWPGIGQASTWTPTYCALGACVTSDGYSGDCACSVNTDCGKFDTCGSITSYITDGFGCYDRSGVPGSSSSCTSAGGHWGTTPWGSYVCTCGSDAECGSGSYCYGITGSGCTGATCTAAAKGSGYSNTDNYQCTPRNSTSACTAPNTYACSYGAPAAGTSGGGKCLCTDNSQCGSGVCATWSGCSGHTCSGAAGTGGADGCVTACTAGASTCANVSGYATTYNAATNTCRCTNNAQCASGNCGGTGARASDNCVPETTYSTSCNPTTCPTGTSLQGGQCWCLNDNQCSTGACVPWTVGVAGCTGPTCSGSGAFDAHHCATSTPTCSTGATTYSCPTSGSWTCDSTLHDCLCTADSACGTGGKCVNSASQCATGACTGTGTPDVHGCQRPTPAIPTSCTATIPYSCSVGTCNAAGTACLCNADNQCPSGLCVDTGQCASGACSGTGSYDAAQCVPLPSGITCSSNAQCGGPAGVNVELCSGASGSPPGLGQCHKICTSNADCTGAATTCDLTKTPHVCTGGLTCTSNAQCPDRTYSGKCAGGSGAVAGTCQGPGTSSGLNSNYFPEACQQTDMSDQEKALEFMFFDLTACVNPDGATPGPPPLVLAPATFPLDFVAACPSGTYVKWREFDFQASFPTPTGSATSAKIDATAQTVDPNTSGVYDYTGATVVTVLSNDTTSTPTGSTDRVLLDTSPGGTGVMTAASVVSKKGLRLTVTMTPSSDLTQSPTLASWKVLYDCPAAE